MLYQGELIVRWLCARIGLVPTEHIKAIGRMKGEQILCAVGYDGFNGVSCHMHVAGDGNWINKEILFAAFDYPFNELKLNLVLGMVPGNNHDALRLDKHLGFKILYEVRDSHPDGSIYLMGMYRNECRWLNGR